MAGASWVRSTILVLWLAAGVNAALHCHATDHGHDAPDRCVICIAAAAPAVAVAHGDTQLREPTVAAILIDVATLAPEAVLFDRPLPRGPPSLS